MPKTHAKIAISRTTRRFLKQSATNWSIIESHRTFDHDALAGLETSFHGRSRTLLVGDVDIPAPTGVPLSSINTQLVFGVTPNATMTNDVPGTLIVNRLTFYSPGPVFGLSNNALDFRTNSSAVLPQIVLNSASGFTIGAPLTLTNNLTVSGIGSLSLNGAIGGGGS